MNRVPADFSGEHVECYDKNNPSNFQLDTAIFEIQPTGIDGVSIEVNIDDEGSITPLYFGENADLDTIFINVDNPSIIGCPSVYGEATSSLKIQNGVIIESECVQLYCLEIRSAGSPGNDLLILRNDQGTG